MDTFDTGRGIAHVVRCGEVLPHLEDIVLLDGKKVRIVAVERPIINDCTSLLVEEK